MPATTVITRTAPTASAIMARRLNRRTSCGFPVMSVSFSFPVPFQFLSSSFPANIPANIDYLPLAPVQQRLDDAAAGDRRARQHSVRGGGPGVGPPTGG